MTPFLEKVSSLPSPCHHPLSPSKFIVSFKLDSLLKRAEGSYSSGMTKEGIVVRSTHPRYSEALRGDLSFKVISNQFLLKDES